MWVCGDGGGDEGEGHGWEKMEEVNKTKKN